MKSITRAQSSALKHDFLIAQYWTVSLHSTDGIPLQYRWYPPKLLDTLQCTDGIPHSTEHHRHRHRCSFSIISDPGSDMIYLCSILMVDLFFVGVLQTPEKSRECKHHRTVASGRDLFPDTGNTRES